VTAPGEAERTPNSDQPHRYRFELDANQTGTVLGALAWVLGAAQIMRDRARLDGDRDLDALHDLLGPQVERALLSFQLGRLEVVDSRLDAEIEAAFARVREAFETWIDLTAADTLSAAVGQRLIEAAERGELDLSPDDMDDGIDDHEPPG